MHNVCVYAHSSVAAVVGRVVYIFALNVTRWASICMNHARLYDRYDNKVFNIAVEYF